LLLGHSEGDAGSNRASLLLGIVPIRSGTEARGGNFNEAWQAAGKRRSAVCFSLCNLLGQRYIILTRALQIRNQNQMDWMGVILWQS
jgi:hypothetical protein